MRDGASLSEVWPSAANESALTSALVLKQWLLWWLLPASHFNCYDPFSSGFFLGTFRPPTTLFFSLIWWNKGNIYCFLIEMFFQDHLDEFGLLETESWKISFSFCFLISFIRHQMRCLQSLPSVWRGGRHRKKKGGGLEIKGSGNEEVALGRKVSEAQDRVDIYTRVQVTNIGYWSQKVTCYLLHFELPV